MSKLQHSPLVHDPSSPQSLASLGEQTPELHHFSETLLLHLDRYGVRYCAFTTPHAAMEAPPIPQELAVHPRDVGKLLATFRSLEDSDYLVVQQITIVPGIRQYCFASVRTQLPTFHEVIVLTGTSANWLLPSATEVVERRQKREVCWSAAATDEFRYRLSMDCLQGAMSATSEQRLQQLIRELGPDEAKRITRDLFGNRWEWAMSAVGAGPHKVRLLKKLRKRLWWRELGRDPVRLVTYAVKAWLEVAGRYFRSNGLQVAILGPDGVGKSSFSGKILEMFRPVFTSGRLLQWRPQVIKPRPPKNPLVFVAPHSKPPHGATESVLRLLAVLADYWVGQIVLIKPLLAQTSLLVYDRNFDDILVDTYRYRYGGPRWVLLLAKRMVPRSDCVCLTLEADPEVILQRKQEVSPEELRRQYAEYRKLAQELPDSHVIRTDRDFELSLAEGSHILVNYLNRRFKRRNQSSFPFYGASRKEGEGRAPLRKPVVGMKVRLLSEIKKYMSHLRSVPALNTLRGVVASRSSGWSKWLAKGMFAVLDQGLISGSNFLMGILLARWLAAEQYGAYALAFAMFILISIVYQSLVLEPMTVFGPSVYHGVMRNYLGILVKLQTVLGSVVFVVGAFAAVYFLYARGSAQLAPALVGATIAGPCVLLFWFARRACYVELSPSRSLSGAIVYMPLLLGSVWILLKLKLLSPFTAFAATGVSALLASAYLLSRLKPVLARQAQGPHLPEVSRRHWEYGRWALAAAVFLWIPWNICYPLVTKFWGLAETGSLRALLNLALPITQTYSAFSLLFLPYTARLSHQEGWPAMKGQAMRIAGLYAGGSAVYWLFVCMFSGPLVRFLYAGRYTEIIPLLPWVGLSSIIAGIVMGPTIVIRAMRSPASVCWIYLFSSAVATGVGIPAIWAWGMRGAVVALALSSLTAIISGFLILRIRVRPEQSPGTVSEPVAVEPASLSSSS
jgi:O-antigen/teichoic acid export membrane protein/thymidylate kinase